VDQLSWQSRHQITLASSYALSKLFGGIREIQLGA
jgi:hypothetical protein